MGILAMSAQAARTTRQVAVSAFTCLSVFSCGPVIGQQTYTVATGDPGGVYYPVAGAICALVNRMSISGPHCRTRASAGSVANIDALGTGEVGFAIVQRDIGIHAYKGTGQFTNDQAFSGLRTVFSLHTESMTILAQRDSGIRTFDDLKGRRVNIGNIGSGQRATMDVVLAAKGWTLDDFSVVSELSATDQTPDLCDGDLEAGVYIVGHPAGVIDAALEACDLVFVSARDPEIEALVAAHHEYGLATIDNDMYPEAVDELNTFGVTASLLTTDRMSDEVVDQLVSSVMRDLGMLRSAHPSLSGLNPRSMVGDGRTLPLHQAAARYFQVTGFLDLNGAAQLSP